MTTKQITLLLCMVAAAQTHTMDQKPKNRSCQPQGPIIFFNQGTLINYGTATFGGRIENSNGATIHNFGHLNAQPQNQQKHPRTPRYYTQNYPKPTQQQDLREKSNKLNQTITELLDLSLSEKTHKQLERIQKLNGLEQVTVGEAIVQTITKNNNIPKLRAEQSILHGCTQDPIAEKYIPQPQKEISYPSLFFAPPHQTLLQPAEKPLWHTAEDACHLSPKKTSPISTPLELTNNQSPLSTWNKIIATHGTEKVSEA